MNIIWLIIEKKNFINIDNLLCSIQNTTTYIFVLEKL